MPSGSGVDVRWRGFAHVGRAARVAGSAAALLAAALPCAGAGASAVARATFTWETVYSGTYSYTGDMRFTGPGPGGRALSEDNQSVAYTWAIERLDTFTDNGKGTFKETVKVADLSTGAATLHNTNTLANQPPQLTTSVDCDIVSTGSAVQRSRIGITGVPAKGPAHAVVSWSVPSLADQTGQYYFDGTRFDPSRSPVAGDAPGVTQHCVDHTVNRDYTTQDGSNLLDSGVYTTNGGIAGNYAWFHYDETSALGWQNHSYPTCGGRSLTPDKSYFDLWDGSRSLSMVEVPYSEDFEFENGISGAVSHPASIDTSATSGRCSDKVSINSHLAFALIDCGQKPRKGEQTPEPTPEPMSAGGSTSTAPGATSNTEVTFDATGGSPGTQACAKVGALLVADGFKILSSAAAILGTGENTTILVPELAEGGAQATPETAVDVQVDGQIIPRHGVREPQAAAVNVVLYKGSATFKAGAPQLVTLTATPQGRSLLAGKHPAVKATGVITARPAAATAQTARGDFTIPATG